MLLLTSLLLFGATLLILAGLGLLLDASVRYLKRERAEERGGKR